MHSVIGAQGLLGPGGPWLRAAACGGWRVAAQAGAAAWGPHFARTAAHAAAAAPAAPAAPVPEAEAPRAAPAAQLGFNDPRAAFAAKSALDILRSLLVFKACQIRPLVRNADAVLDWSTRLLGSTLVNAVIRRTFYKQFVAGTDAQSIQPTLRFLRENGIRAILDYAAEDDVDEQPAPKSKPETLPLTMPHSMVTVRTYPYAGEDLADRRMSVFLKSIEAAAAAEGQGFAAIKVTALGLPALLERVSNAHRQIYNLFNRFDASNDGVIDREEFERIYNELFVDDGEERREKMFQHLDTDRDGKVDYVGWSKQVSVHDTRAIASRCRSRGPFAEAALSEEECHLLDAMMGRVDRLAKVASEAGVRLMIDAEHTYFQPAIDSVVTEMQRRYNRDEPVVFNTIQCYLKDSHERLRIDLERARREGYKYGAKLVRGAYMVLERARAVELGYPSPIQDSKADTHANYDRCMREMLQYVASEGCEVMVATHNQESIERTVTGMGELGLPPSSGVYFGQLLGMADHLTFTLGRAGYGAYKYVPFGAVDEVMPYLIRRAQENSDMLGGVGKEVAMMRTELKRRLFGGS